MVSQGSTPVHSPTFSANLESANPMRLRQLIEFPSLILVIAFVAQLDVTTGVKQRSSIYSTWTSVYTPSESGVSTARALRAGDDGNNGERGGLSVPFTERLKRLVATATPEKLQSWLGKGKPADAVFIRMRLDKAKSWLIYSDEFTQWLNYVDDLNKVSKKETSAMSILSTHFGDAELYTMIEGAHYVTRTKDLAAKLEGKLMQHWVATAKTPDDVFHLMELDKVERDLIRNAKLHAWSKYVDDFNARYPEKATSMIPTLRLQQYDDRFMFTMAAAGMKVEATENVATKLQEQLIHAWLTSRKSPDDALIQGYLANNQSPEKVFKLLALDDVGDTILSNPLFKRWKDYVEDFNNKHPGQRQSWFDPLRWNYQWYGVERMIERAMQNPNTVSIAKSVEKEWHQYWLAQKKLPQNAFHFLGLNKAGGKTLANPKFQTWIEYLHDFNQLYPVQKTTMIDGLRANYNDINLLRIFDKAKKDPSTEKLATNLQSALIDKWVGEKIPLETLKGRFNHIPNSDEMIERYVKKLGS
ncbi:unnamed protein product [Phytophthora fragariaefolia]|uniref:Unnamed protein product n=1 Tax=Phytophthora fragariaefolia TaxID=1490495 RepID=A0A9W6YEX5_9STRA|nr:unnamed protein product [Phytophthora fragariaefolia]